ncbi:MAG: LysM peptidoglycan-binding domain-containing protein [Smithella sp.]
MPKTKIIRYAFLLFLLLTSVAFAQTKEMKKHKVIKGDTLWDIANTELENPFFWPKIWKENTWLKNPHRIYPNQIVKIPAYLLKKEKLKDNAMRQNTASNTESEVIQEEFEKNKYPLIDKNTFMSSGYITHEVPNGGKIGESSSGQFVYGDGDTFWVDFDHPVKVGSKFYIIKVSDIVKHPVTRANIGYVISIGGIAEIIKVTDDQTMAKISECFREIDKGELLVPYFEMKYPMTTGQFRNPGIEGVIIAAQNGEQYQSTFDIIYLDKGREDGVETGDLFRTDEVVNNHTIPNGVIQVINCREHTATAIIKSSNSIISAGNLFVGLNKN